MYDIVCYLVSGEVGESMYLCFMLVAFLITFNSSPGNLTHPNTCSYNAYVTHIMLEGFFCASSLCRRCYLVTVTMLIDKPYDLFFCAFV